jgi:predicted RNA binding protein YcfA (HicA-like mRNA interferase family)
LKLPRDLSSELAKALAQLGYRLTRQTGSHLRLTSIEHGEHQVTIPRHGTLRMVALAAVLGEVARHFDLSRTEHRAALRRIGNIRPLSVRVAGPGVRRARRQRPGIAMAALIGIDVKETLDSPFLTLVFTLLSQTLGHSPSCGRCPGSQLSSPAGPGCGITQRISGASSRGCIGRCNGPPAGRGNGTRAPFANGAASARRR